MTLTALAEAAGISRSYLSEIENERASDPSASVVRALAGALDTNTAVLLEEDTTTLTTQIPESLKRAQVIYEIPEEDIQSLAAVKFRNFQPVMPEDWKFLYESIKRSMPRDIGIE